MNTISWVIVCFFTFILVVFSIAAFKVRKELAAFDLPASQRFLLTVIKGCKRTVLVCLLPFLIVGELLGGPYLKEFVTKLDTWLSK